MSGRLDAGESRRVGELRHVADLVDEDVYRELAPGDGYRTRGDGEVHHFACLCVGESCDVLSQVSVRAIGVREQAGDVALGDAVRRAAVVRGAVSKPPRDNPANGLVRDATRPGSHCSVTALGLGLAAYTVGAERGYVSRVDAGQRGYLCCQVLPIAIASLGLRLQAVELAVENRGLEFAQPVVARDDMMLVPNTGRDASAVMDRAAGRGELVIVGSDNSSFAGRKVLAGLKGK